MSKISEESLLSDAIEGKHLSKPRGIPSDIEPPWKRIVSEDTMWAVYRVSGEHQANATERAIRRLTSVSSITPCLLVDKSEELGTVATTFFKLKVPVIVEIGGKATLVRPRTVKKRMTSGTCRSRVSPYVLQGCVGLKNLDRGLCKLLTRLARKYKAKSTWDDEYEHSVLEKFFLEFAELNGLSADAGRAHEFLLRLEQAGMGGSRDHYFHSFQNFFFGLSVIGGIHDYFRKSLSISKLEWNIPLEFTWFLVCLWHDIGYGLQSLANIETTIFGIDMGAGTRERLSEYVNSPPVLEGKRAISSLIEHLLQDDPQTAWMEPRLDSQPTPMEQALQGAIDADLRAGHGAASALRLYTDMKTFINKCAIQTKRNILMQSTLIAAASIPFHDWHFRRCVREQSTPCRVPALTMPFAALLAFVDSIQEDRRRFDGVGLEKAFLERIVIEEARVVSAEVNGGALGAADVIWKIVEATDVLASIERTEDSFDVRYPQWLVA
jgi:hypothetical protein